MTTPKQKRRRYRLHYNLRRKGNKVSARERTVERRAKIVTEIESKWLSELIAFGYCVGDGIFSPPILMN
jgi:hypothetical protein